MDNFDVLFAKSLSKGGGGSGTDNYNELINKPQINGNSLTGNKTGANLGLQDAITSESKLSSDLVDDTGAENLFVSSTEKSTWGGKQDPATTLSGYGITDAYTKTETGTQITDAIGALDVSSVGGSGKYISAISETDGKISATAETMDTTPTSGSEKAVTSGAVYTALASKQDELTDAQQAAVDSGITAAKLTADEAALVELVDGGAKNLLKIEAIGADSTTYGTTVTKNGVEYALQADGSIVINRVSSNANSSYIFFRKQDGSADYITDYMDNEHYLSGITGGSVGTYAFFISNYNGQGTSRYIGDPALLTPSSVAQNAWGISIASGYSPVNLVIKPMICTKTAWDISHAYKPYCPSMAEMYEMILALQNGTRSAPALAMAEPKESRTEPEEVEPETGEEEMR